MENPAPDEMIPPQSLTARPEKWWLEDDPFLLGRELFRGYVKLRGGGTQLDHQIFFLRESPEVMSLLLSLTTGSHFTGASETQNREIDSVNRQFDSSFSLAFLVGWKILPGS